MCVWKGFNNLRKHPFLLALRRWGRLARRNDVPPREKSPAAKSEEKRMFSQGTQAKALSNYLGTELT